MLDDTLAKIKALKAELKKLEDEYAAQAGRAAEFADAAAREAGRPDRSPKRARAALDGLSDAARELEATHPNLAAAISEICRELSSLGI